MRIERRFDFGRINILTTGDDHVLFSIDQEDVPAFVYGREIAGVQPSIAQHVLCVCRTLPISGHNVWTPSDDLADVSWTRVAPILANYSDLDSIDRPSTRRESMF